MLTTEQVRATGDWIARHQQASGELPWWQGGKTDPWDHVHAAMGLTVAGRANDAARAYRFLATTQTEHGGWFAERRAGKPTDRTVESNHAAYIATGLWQHFLATGDEGFLATMWPTLERAIRFALSLQDDSGAVFWAIDERGKVWSDPLLTGCSSIHGSLVCASRIAAQLGHARPAWHDAREQLALALREKPELFEKTHLPEAVGRYSMDWYYPVLGGALRGAAAKDRLHDRSRHDAFIAEGVGCRCVHDSPWYTVAESCELVLALDAGGMTSRAHQILSWTRQFRMEDGGYWTGKTYPENVFWPIERNTWTAAAVIIAADALTPDSPTGDLFRSLGGDNLAEARRAIAS